MKTFLGSEKEIAHDFTDQFWGHALHEFRYDNETGTISGMGHCQQRIEVGHLLLYKSGTREAPRLSAIRVAEIEWMRDPRDMFSYEAKLPTAITSEEWALIQETAYTSTPKLVLSPTLVDLLEVQP